MWMNFLVFWDRVPLYNNTLTGTHFVDHTGLKLRSAHLCFLSFGIKVGTTTTWLFFTPPPPPCERGSLKWRKSFFFHRADRTSVRISSQTGEPLQHMWLKSLFLSIFLLKLEAIFLCIICQYILSLGHMLWLNRVHLWEDRTLGDCPSLAGHLSPVALSSCHSCQAPHSSWQNSRYPAPSLEDAFARCSVLSGQWILCCTCYLVEPSLRCFGSCCSFSLFLCV